MPTKPFAFVLMPFDSGFGDIYKLGIQAVAKNHGIIAERVDEQRYTESILERIYRQIETADFIIADMSGRNANVFYEVGYAHAKGKLCTLLTQSADDIPFDLKHHRHIVYGNSIQTLKSKLDIEMRWLKSESQRPTTAITVELKSSNGNLDKNSWSATGEVEFIFDIHNRTERRSPDIEAIYLYTKKDWSFKQGEDLCPSTRSDDKPGVLKYFIKSPVPRLSPGAWAQIKITGKYQFWNKWSGEELKERYTNSGFIQIDLSTSEGLMTYQVDASVDFEEIPF